MEVVKILDEYELILLPEEVAEILRIGMNEMYKILNSGDLPAFKAGSTWRIPKNNLLNYINKRTS